VNQQLHCLALELLVVSFLNLLFLHGFSLFTLSFRVRKIRGGSYQGNVRHRCQEVPSCSSSRFSCANWSVAESFWIFRVRLKVPPSSLGAYYEAGNICAAFYAADALLDEDSLVQDLQTCLICIEFSRTKKWPCSEVTEDLTRVRWHRRIDRDQRALQLLRKVKGHTCEVCGFDFEARYGDLGRGFIEIHHLTPISELEGLVVSKNPERDYAALCSNCHSMIHRTEAVHDLNALRVRLH